jgi:hypothetical protein
VNDPIKHNRQCMLCWDAVGLLLRVKSVTNIPSASLLGVSSQEQWLLNASLFGFEEICCVHPRSVRPNTKRSFEVNLRLVDNKEVVPSHWWLKNAPPLSELMLAYQCSANLKYIF